jgi:chromosome segregation protein
LCRRTYTWFLITTHHGVTLARLDRLFGVRLLELGVSLLFSVYLKLAEQLVA